MSKPKISVKIEGKKVFLNGERAKKRTTSSSRACYFTKDYVIKIETGEWYMGQCSHEATLYDQIERADKKFFVPIIKYKKVGKSLEFVVQPRVKFKSIRRKKWMWDFVLDIADKYNLSDFCEDLNCNWGIDEHGNIKIFDYGV